MPEEPEKKEEREDADAGTLLKTAIDRLDSLHKRMDAMDDAMHRRDSEEEEEKEEAKSVAADKKHRKDAEEEEEEKKDDDDSIVMYRGNKAPTKKKDSRSDDDDDDAARKRKDARRRDDDDDDDARHKKDDDDDAKHRKDARRRDDDDDDSRKRKDDDDDDARVKRSRKDDDDDDSKKRKDAEEEEEEEKEHRSDSAISRRIARVERMLPKQLSDDDRAAFSDAQARADEIYHAFGSQAPAPMQGETLIAYRQRIANKLKEHSPAWKKTNLNIIAADNEAFSTVESAIYADAMTVASSPATAEPGTLRMITNISGGHEIHTFVGEPSAWMDPMAGPVRMHVTSINTPNRSNV